jgi:putative membrane protein
MTTSRNRCLAASATLCLLGGAALAADIPSTVEVLGKLPDADQSELAMGKLAEKDGHSEQVKDFGKMLVKDHTGADKKVTASASIAPSDGPASIGSSQRLTGCFGRHPDQQGQHG